MHIIEEEETREQLQKNKEMILLKSSNNTMDMIFRRVDYYLKKKITDDARNGSMDNYIAELIQYSNVYYEQLITNIGLSFKIDIISSIFSGNYLDDKMMTSYNERIIEIYFNKLNYVLSMPLVEMYSNFTDMSNEDRNLLFSCVKHFLNGLLKLTADIILSFIRSIYNGDIDIVDIDYYHEGWHKANLNASGSNYLDEVFNLIYSKVTDEPWSEQELEVHNFLYIVASVFNHYQLDPTGSLLINYFTKKGNGYGIL